MEKKYTTTYLQGLVSSRLFFPDIVLSLLSSNLDPVSSGF